MSETPPKARDEIGPASADAEDAPRVYEAKIRAEYDDADSAAGATAPSWSGDPLAGVLVVKGQPGPAERAGEPPFTGEDGEALRKALGALGMPAAFLGVYAGGTSIDAKAAEERLAVQIASADPAVVIAADGTAAQIVARVLGIAAPPFGRVVDADGRMFVALEGFEKALADEAAKKRAWQQLKSLREGARSEGRAAGKA